MDPRLGSSTYRVFNALVKGRTLDREAALASLGDPGQLIDRSQLRALILNALVRDFGVRKREVEPASDQERSKADRDPVAMTRRWLLRALASISDDDIHAQSAVRKHLDPEHEPNRWVRHDALAGLVATGAPDLQDLARTIRDRDGEPWPHMLAVAILASQGDDQALDELRANLGDEFWQVSTLRALRTVPVEEVADQVVSIARGVGTDKYRDDVVYDAIVALGRFASTWTQAEDATEVLLASIRYCRRHSWLVDLWAKTLRSLGNLGSRRAIPWIVEELTNDNPSIIFEAAVALQKVLGTPSAVARVVEAASEANRNYIEGYASALRWMSRESVVEKLEEMMTSAPVEQQETARLLLIELGGLAAFQKVRARADAVAQYTKELEKVEKQIRDLFDRSIQEAQRGFRLATFMDLTVFVLGVLLLASSAALVLIGCGDLGNWVGVGATGGTGILGVVYGVLIKNPRRQIVQAVDHLMYLKVIFLGYLRQLHQADQAYTRRMLEDQPLTVQDVGDFSDLIGETMRIAVEQLSPTVSPRSPTEPEKDDVDSAPDQDAINT
jgi:HEAT repeat protein